MALIFWGKSGRLQRWERKTHIWRLWFSHWGIMTRGAICHHRIKSNITPAIYEGKGGEKNKDKKISRKGRSRLTCDELERLWESVGPSGKLLQPEGDGAGEGEGWVERRRSQTSQWLHGVMHLWSAAMDCNPRSLLFVLHILMSCVTPAFSVVYPPNEGKTTLGLQTSVFVCARACVNVCERCASAPDRSTPRVRSGLTV